MQVLSQHGETLDQVCWRALGSTDQVDAVYAANRGLAAHGPILPDRTPVQLPETVSRAAPLRETVTLWN